MADYAVIMAGGSGTRFWPASREARPKQLLALGGATGESLLAATVKRLHPLVPKPRVFVVTAARLADATYAALPEVPRENILCEPKARNTAPCIAWATSVLLAKDPDATIAVLPSDHHVEDEAAFRDVLAQALAAAKTGVCTTVGIVPTRAETGFGYIEVGDDRGGGAKRVRGFVEKPDRARAEGYVAGGKHLWNAGMFFYRADVMQRLLEEHLPAMAEGAKAMVRRVNAGDAGAVAEIFPTLESISIDNGVMEKAKELAVVPGSFGWSDVGSWQSAWELAAKDGSGNALPEGAFVKDAERNYFTSLVAGGKAKHVAFVGVSDLVVVETDDAVLVMPRERAQDVKLVVEALKKAGKTELL